MVKVPALSSLSPVIDQLKRVAGFERGDPPEARLGKLERLLAQSDADVAATAPIFAQLLSIPGGERHPPPEVPAQRQKEATLQGCWTCSRGLRRGGRC